MTFPYTALLKYSHFLLANALNSKIIIIYLILNASNGGLFNYFSELINYFMNQFTEETSTIVSYP